MSELPFSVLPLIDLGPTARLPLEPSLGVIRHQILGSDPPHVTAELDLDIIGKQRYVVDLTEILVQSILECLEIGEPGRRNLLEYDRLLGIDASQRQHILLLPAADMLPMHVQ